MRIEAEPQECHSYVMPWAWAPQDRRPQECEPPVIRAGRPLRGFTVMEIVVVLGLVALVLGIGIPYFLYNRAMRDIDGGARQFGNLLAFARQTAVTRGGATVAFTTTTPPLRSRLTDAAGRVVKTLDFPNKVTVTLPGNQTTYVFAANGTVNQGGTFTFGRQGYGSTMSIVLNPTTGGVTGP